MATDKQRYTVSVDDELFHAIEDYRFENRYATRSEATVALIRLGLNSLGSGSLTQLNSTKPPRKP